MAVTFGQLKTRISTETNRTSAAEISAMGEAIITAIKYYEKKRLWFTEQNTTLTLLTGTNSVSLPANFKSLIKLRVLVSGQYRGEINGFEGTPYDRLKDEETDPTRTGSPEIFSLFANTVRVTPLADQDYTLDLDYIKGDTTYPSADADSSVWFGDEGQDVIRYKALEIYYRDVLHAEEKAAYYEAAAEKFFNNLLSYHNTREAYTYILA